MPLLVFALPQHQQQQQQQQQQFPLHHHHHQHQQQQQQLQLQQAARQQRRRQQQQYLAQQQYHQQQQQQQYQLQRFGTQRSGAMGTKIEYVDTTQLYATKYIRNSKAIAVLWAIFTICYAIIGIVAFVTPEWIGDPDSESAGRLGLWQVCQKDEIFDSCKRRWEHIFTVPNFSFQLATFFMVAAVALALMTICFLIFLLFMKSTRVFHICGWMQIISALCMIVACAAFPFGWNSDDFRKICGPEANRFELGLCGIRWAYPLAIIGCIDGVVLATLAFILATRHVRLQPDPLYQNSLYKGEINNAYITDAVSLAGSRKSLNLQPILLVAPPGDDTISQFSSRTPNHRYHRPDYHNSMHQF